MSFINFDVQQAFFHVLRARREKREMYGAVIHPSFICPLFFDRCLDIISCHHPDIWSHGTGNLLVASTTSEILRYKKTTKSEIRAYEWRIQAMHSHIFEYGLRSIDDEGFGYFVRRTIEYRNRMIIFRYHSEQRNIFLTDDEIERFLYIDKVVHQIEDVVLKVIKVNKIGHNRYGLLFVKMQLSKGQTDYQIYDEIEECIRKPTTVALKEFLHDIHPELFLSERVASQLSFDMYSDNSGYDEDDEDEDTEPDRIITVPPQLVESDKQSECVVCLQEKEVLVWPCHITHVTCKECIIKIIKHRQLACPLCRKYL